MIGPKVRPSRRGGRDRWKRIEIGVDIGVLRSGIRVGVAGGCVLRTSGEWLWSQAGAPELVGGIKIGLRLHVAVPGVLF